MILSVELLSETEHQTMIYAFVPQLCSAINRKERSRRSIPSPFSSIAGAPMSGHFNHRCIYIAFIFRHRLISPLSYLSLSLAQISEIKVKWERTNVPNSSLDFS